MRAADLMTRDPAVVTPDDTVQVAAKRMEECDCGLVPVVADRESKRVVGVVTDRDLALRVLGQGRGTDVRVSEVMTADPDCVRPDDDVDRIERLMADRQLRRIVVVDEAGRCVGVVAQADLARASREAPDEVSHFEVAQTIQRISEPEVATDDRDWRSTRAGDDRSSERDASDARDQARDRAR